MQLQPRISSAPISLFRVLPSYPKFPLGIGRWTSWPLWLGYCRHRIPSFCSGICPCFACLKTARTCQEVLCKLPINLCLSLFTAGIVLKENQFKQRKRIAIGQPNVGSSEHGCTFCFNYFYFIISDYLYKTMQFSSWLVRDPKFNLS